MIGFSEVEYCVRIWGITSLVIHINIYLYQYKHISVAIHTKPFLNQMVFNYQTCFLRHRRRSNVDTDRRRAAVVAKKLMPRNTQKLPLIIFQSPNPGSITPNHRLLVLLLRSRIAIEPVNVLGWTERERGREREERENG